MAPIPGWTYILVGVAIAGFTKFVQSRTEPGALQLFFYLGIVFIVIGVVKYLLKGKFESKKKKTLNYNQLSQTQDLRQHPAQQNHTIHQAVYRQQHNAHQHPNTQQHPALHHMRGQHTVQRASQQQGQQEQHPTIISCPNCGTRHYSYAMFCMRCGTKMK